MQQKCSMGFSGVYQFLYLIWGFFRKSLQVQGIIFGFKLWPFTRLGGLSKFHAMPIFTVQALKVRKIFGMWVKYSFMTWTRREKVTATIKISCHEKVYDRCENISCREQISVTMKLNFTPWKSSILWKSYCLWRKSAHTEETFYFSILLK